MRWPGVMGNLYHRALPGASTRSLALAGEPSSGNAFGHESLSRALTRHADVVPALGVPTATKPPGSMPGTDTTKKPCASGVTVSVPPTAAPPTSEPRKQLGAEYTCRVIG